MSVIQVVLQIFARVNDAVTLVANIIGTLITSGWYIVVRDAANLTTDIHSLLEDPTCGQQAQCAQLSTIISDLATLAGDIAALGSPQQTGVAVTLPAVPPSAYVAPTSGANASAVWATVSADAGTQMGAIMAIQSAFWRIVRDSLAFDGRLSPGFNFQFDPTAWVNNGFTSWVEVSITDIQPTDADLLGFLTRTAPSLTWHQTGEGTWWADVGSGNALIQCKLTEGEFEFLRMLAGGPPAAGIPVVPPVWPGLAGVTLGTPVAIVPTSQTITGPLNGVILDLTTIPQPLPFFDLNAAQGWSKIGQLTFVDDNGDAEPQQLLSFVHGLFMPKSMTRAVSCGVKTLSGLGGTITPFTIP